MAAPCSRGRSETIRDAARILPVAHHDVGRNSSWNKIGQCFAILRFDPSASELAHQVTVVKVLQTANSVDADREVARLNVSLPTAASGSFYSSQLTRLHALSE